MARRDREKQLAAHWLEQIHQCEEEYKRWYDRCKKISQRYRDERKTIDDEKRNLNLFWSNVQTLKPAIYSKPPVAICERRFLDRDDTGRVAATILERNLRYEVSMGGLHETLKKGRDDYLLVGRGQAWVRYNPLFGDAISPLSTGNDDIKAEDGETLEQSREDEEDRITREKLRDSLDVCYVHWQDYFQLPPRVRTEEEIQGKARRIYMSREDLVERFGKRIGKKVPLDHVPQANPDSGSKGLVQGEDAAQATIYEIWWKPTKRVYFVAKEYDDLLEETDDPLELDGFFPCPPALMATTTNDTMIPVPDYAESQDQYVQIDHLTKRIQILTEALQVRGVYDASAQALKRLFEEGKEPDLIPVDSWAMFAERGGLKGAIDFVPIKDIADTLQTVIEVRTKIIEDLDRTTGIWDIMRGTSDARETMGAQRLKQNNGTGRLQDRKDDMATFARNILSIMGEIISEHYDPKTLIQVSGALYDDGIDIPDQQPQIANQLPPPQLPPSSLNNPSQAPAMLGQGQGPPLGLPTGTQQGAGPPSIISGPENPQIKMQRRIQVIADAIELLKNDKLRGFRIDIETDSTIQNDAQEEKAMRIEFVKGVTEFVEQAGIVGQQVPEFVPLAGKMLQFAVRGFRVGRDLEAAIEDFCEKAEQDAKAAAANPQAREDPKVQTERIKQDTEKMKAQAEVQAQQVEAQSEARNRQLEEGIKMMDVRMKQMEMHIEAMRAAAEERKINMEAHAGVIEHAHEMERHGMEMESGEREHAQQMALSKQQHTGWLNTAAGNYST